jgi:hypothetical protein
MSSQVPQFQDAASSSAAKEEIDIAARCLAVWQEVGLTAKPVVEWFPRNVVPFSAFYARIFDTSAGTGLDAIVLAEERRNAPLYNLRDHIPLSLVPVIDIGGRAGKFADVHFDLKQQTTWVDTARCILEFRARREKLNPFVAASLDSSMRLLAQCFVAGRILQPLRHGATTEGVCYPGLPSAQKTIELAEGLVARQFLSRTFFDRLHECARCHSRRLSVREECPSCRSTQLEEMALVHHYRCAALLPEDRFRRDTYLVCPKCSSQLRHYGKDYDKPGSTQICTDCGHSSSEPAIGFVCLDCDMHVDGDDVIRRDVFSYSLTEEGIAALTRRAVAPAPKGLPRALVDEVLALRNSWEAEQVMVAEIRYGARDGLIADRGALVFDKLRSLFLENMVNFLAGVATLYPSDAADYFLFRAAKDDMPDVVAHLMQESQALLKEPLSAQLRVASNLAKAAP